MSFEIESILNFLYNIFYDHIYLGIFISAIVEITFPPIPTFAIFPMIGHIAAQKELGLLNIIILGIVGALGSTIGSILLYIISLKIGRIIILKFTRISENKLKIIDRWFEKKGDITVLLCRLIPILREAVSISAGIFKMNKILFFIYTFFGSFIWCMIFLMIGYYFYEDIQDLLGIYFINIYNLL